MQSALLLVPLPPSLKLWRDKLLRKLACRTGFLFHLKGVFNCAAQLNFVSLRHRGIYLLYESDNSEGNALPCPPPHFFDPDDRKRDKKSTA